MIILICKIYLAIKHQCRSRKAKGKVVGTLSAIINNLKCSITQRLRMKKTWISLIFLTKFLSVVPSTKNSTNRCSPTSNKLTILRTSKIPLQFCKKTPRLNHKTKTSWTSLTILSLQLEEMKVILPKETYLNRKNLLPKNCWELSWTK